jgi:hypothetical protein
MSAVVVIHRLKNFDEWFKQFKANPPPKLGHWRVLRGIEDRNRAHVVGELCSATSTRCRRRRSKSSGSRS